MRARLVPALVAVAVLAVGCSDDQDPDASPTLPPITAAPSESPTAEAVPSEATAATPEGATEFARFFVNEVQGAYEQLDPEPIRRLSTPECEACQRYMEAIESIRDQGASISPGFSTEVVDAVAPQESPEATATSVTLILRTGEFVVTGTDGTELAREPADEQLVQEISLQRVDAGWRVNEVVNQ